MPTYARIQNNIVRELLTAPELPPFHPDIEEQFVAVPPGTQVSEYDSYDPATQTFSTPSPAPAPADPQAPYNIAIADVQALPNMDDTTKQALVNFLQAAMPAN